MHATVTALVLASPLVKTPLALLESVLPILGELWALVEAFRAAPPSPSGTFAFETQVQAWLRELGRRIVQWTYNSLEPELPTWMPPDVSFEGEAYRRRARQPRRGSVWTLFGPIRLVRWVYQSRQVGEPALFPLEINLGIEPGGATPALALRVAWLTAAATQTQTLEILRQDHGVHFSVATLRKLTAAVAEQLGQHQHEVQLARLLELLRQAHASSGPRCIVLSIGRDGVFVPVRQRGPFQEAAAATVAVYDRAGKRLGTVYLGRMPQPGQTTLSTQLTRLLTDVLTQWHGPLPRLCYVTDAGHHPTEYFRTVLQRMRHPRTGAALHWEWVIDYYHVCGYVTKLAEALFGAGPEAATWAHKMRRWLRDKAHGAYRVLHSAAALKDRRGLQGSPTLYADAYQYLRTRLAFLDYVDYRRRGLPIGSGVTEAACKHVFTWRFKQSGMTWNHASAQTILDLRLLRVSRVWHGACQAHLAAKPTLVLHTPTHTLETSLPFKKAA